MSSLAILVDENDNIIGYKDRHQMEKGDIFRISLLWVENDKGQVLLAKRALNKKQMPGLWGPAAAGTLEPNETYESNVYKEAEEEIGLTGLRFKFVKRWMYWTHDGVGRYVSAYRTIVNRPAKDFVIQIEEVDRVEWWDKKEILNKLKNAHEIFVGSADYWEELFLN